MQMKIAGTLLYKILYMLFVLISIELFNSAKTSQRERGRVHAIVQLSMLADRLTVS